MSSITFHYKSDLLKSDAQLIVHQCNCSSSKAKGLAKAIFDRFPYANVYGGDVKRKPGSVKLCGKGLKKDQRYVVAMFAQLKPGGPSKKDTSEMRVAWFKSCLARIGKIKPLKSVAFPMNIGCGLAQGNWDEYLSLIEEWAETHPRTDVYIISDKPQPDTETLSDTDGSDDSEAEPPKKKSSKSKPSKKSCSSSSSDEEEEQEKASEVSASDQSEDEIPKSKSSTKGKTSSKKSDSSSEEEEDTPSDNDESDVEQAKPEKMAKQVSAKREHDVLAGEGGVTKEFLLWAWAELTNNPYIDHTALKKAYDAITDKSVFDTVETDNDPESDVSDGEEEVEVKEDEDMWKRSTLKHYLEDNIPDGWDDFFKKSIKEEIGTISDALKKISKTHDISPPLDCVFAAFDFCPLEDVKVIILGQDPYPGKGLAQGVLLINTALTINTGEKESHIKLWSKFTKLLLMYLNTHCPHLVVMLWGAKAQAYSGIFNRKNHLVIEAPHPAASQYNPSNTEFVDHKPFTRANKALKKWKMEPIDWEIE